MRYIGRMTRYEHNGDVYIRNEKGEWFMDMDKIKRVSEIWYKYKFDKDTDKVSCEYPPKEEELEAEYGEMMKLRCLKEEGFRCAESDAVREIDEFYLEEH